MNDKLTVRSNSTTALLANWFLGLPRIQRAGMLLWMLAMISLPVQIWALGLQFLPVSVSVNVIIQVILVVLILWEQWGWKKTWTISVMVVFLTWLFEYWGAATGVPFGSYTYTDRLQPQILGVPMLIPLAWLMMMPSSWAVGQVLARRFEGKRFHWILFGLLSGAAMTAWDFFLDPQMVKWDFWIWEVPGGFYGIPWSNFLGWLVVSTLITWVIRPGNLPVYPLVLVYILTMFLQAFGETFFWSLPGPALVGLIILGLFVILRLIILGKEN